MPTKLKIKRSDYTYIAGGNSDLEDGELIVSRNIVLTGPQTGTSVIDRTLYVGDGVDTYTYLPVSGAGGGNVTDAMLMTSAMFGATPQSNKQGGVCGRTTIYNRFVYLPELEPFDDSMVMGKQAKAVINGVYQNAVPFVVPDPIRPGSTAVSGTERYALVFADYNIDRTGIKESGGFATGLFQHTSTARGRLLDLIDAVDLPTTEAEIDALMVESTLISQDPDYLDNLMYAGAILIPTTWSYVTDNIDDLTWDTSGLHDSFYTLSELYAAGTDFGKWGRVSPNLADGDVYDVFTQQITDKSYVDIAFGDYHPNGDFEFPDDRYMVMVTPSSYKGSEMQLGSISVEGKTRQGFKINTNGWVDKLVVDWFAVYVGR